MTPYQWYSLFVSKTHNGSMRDVSFSLYWSVQEGNGRTQADKDIHEQHSVCVQCCAEILDGSVFWSYIRQRLLVVDSVCKLPAHVSLLRAPFLSLKWNVVRWIFWCWRFGLFFVKIDSGFLWFLIWLFWFLVIGCWIIGYVHLAWECCLLAYGGICMFEVGCWI